MVRLKRPFGKGRLLVAFVVACSLLGGKPCLFRDGGPICPTPPRKPSTLRAVFLYSPVRPGPVRTESGFNRFVGPCRPWQEEGSQESQKRREEATKNPQKHARNAAIAMAAFGAVAAVGVTVVVAGASGRVGKAVLESLRRLPGVDVVALARDGAKARAQTGTDGLSVLEADFADTAALAVVGAISTYPHNPSPSQHGVAGLPDDLMEVFRKKETVDLGRGRQLIGNVWGDAFSSGALGPARERLLQMYTTGKIRSLLKTKSFVGLGSIPDAVDYMLSGSSIGKVWVQCCV